MIYLSQLIHSFRLLCYSWKSRPMLADQFIVAHEARGPSSHEWKWNLGGGKLRWTRKCLLTFFRSSILLPEIGAQWHNDFRWVIQIPSSATMLPWSLWRPLPQSHPVTFFRMQAGSYCCLFVCYFDASCSLPQQESMFFLAFRIEIWHVMTYHDIPLEEGLLIMTYHDKRWL